MRVRLGLATALVLFALFGGAAAVQAGPFTPTAPDEVSDNPLAACPPDGLGIVFESAEVEPWIDINPENPLNIAGFYQQDRYSNGGAKSNVASVTVDGGATWTQTVPDQLTRCTDGGPFERASDPWISFGPTGDLHAMSLVLDPDPPTGGFGDNGMVYNRSTDGGLTWEDPIALRIDTDPNYLNDKNSITADPNDERFVYAVWDRLHEPSRAQHAQDNPIGAGFKGPIWFARSTNGGDSFEPARRIYETGANKQTIGNQIVVEPESEGGSLFDFFGDIVNRSQRRKTLGPIGLAYIRSDNHGATWTKPFQVASQLPMSLFRASSTIDPDGAVDCPEPDANGNCPIRGGDFIPEVAVNRSNGNLYAVWMDARFGTGGTAFGPGAFQYDSIAYTQSTNGGLTWSTPIKVNLTPESEPPGDRQAFTPSVHVSDDGTVTVSYYDFRDNSADPLTLPTSYFAVHCHADCANRANWGDETRIAGPFDITEAAFARGWFLGDYMGLASDGNEFLPLFGSTVGTGPSSISFSRLVP